MRMISDFTEDDANSFDAGADAECGPRVEITGRKRFCWTNGDVRSKVRLDEQISMKLSESGLRLWKTQVSEESGWPLERSGQTMGASLGW